MKTARCLCCGEILKEEENLYHARCMKKLFRSMHIPALNYTQDELNTLAKETILNRISVPASSRNSRCIWNGVKRRAVPA